MPVATAVFISCSAGPDGTGTNGEASAWVERTLASLTLEEKVGQLVCSDVTADYVAEEDPNMQRWLRLAGEHGLGMFVLYGGTPRDVAHLLNRLQREAEIPILMAADFEGGPGQQVRGATEFPANMAFAAVGDDDLVYRAAAAGAMEGRAMGIHLTYTPVVDISLRPENPAESVRSFGGDLDLLGRMVRAYVGGYHDNGMLTSAKHFPGRGDVDPMPDNAPFAWNSKPAEAVAAQDFVAFKHAIDAGVDFVMSEHVAVPAVTDGSELPASVERKLATGWLRDSLGFAGILTTDDLWYDHVTARFGAEEVAVRAFEAGHDIILKPRDPIATIDALVTAVRSGRISERRVDDAVRKLLGFKAQLNLHNDRFVDESRLGQLVGTSEHWAIAQEVADRSLTLLKNEGVLPVESSRMVRAVNINIQKSVGDASPAALDAMLMVTYPDIRSFTLHPALDRAVYDAVWRAVAESDLVILSLFVQRDKFGDATPVRRGDLAFMRRVIQTKPGGVVAMAYGNPHLIREIPDVAAFLVGYGERGWFGNQEVYFDSFIKALSGEIVPSGRLPVRVSDRYPLGSGMTF
jgi:beta-N-acetylhexosaminidase